MDLLVGRTSLTTFPSAYYNKKLLFRPRIRTPASHAPIEHTAHSFTAVIRDGWGKKETQYCELLKSDTAGKPFFDYDRKYKVGEPARTSAQSDVIQEQLLGTLTRAWRRFDEEFNPLTQVHIAIRHRWIQTSEGRVWKVRLMFSLTIFPKVTSWRITRSLQTPEADKMKY